MFEQFDPEDKFLIYRSLLDSIRANTGRGFINGDQGHPAYKSGAEGHISLGTHGDDPDHNRLYKMMLELSGALKDRPELQRSDLVLSWEDFCKMAVDSYDAPAGPRQR